MTSPSLKHELVKLRILSFLSDPMRLEFGSTSEALERSIDHERMVTTAKVLDELAREGLVERNPDSLNKRAKPYFITERGKSYLQQKVDAGLCVELQHQPDWHGRHLRRQLHELIAEHLRALPEFNDATEDRIIEISRALVRVTGQARSQSV